MLDFKFHHYGGAGYFIVVSFIENNDPSQVLRQTEVKSDGSQEVISLLPASANQAGSYSEMIK